MGKRSKARFRYFTPSGRQVRTRKRGTNVLIRRRVVTLLEDQQ